MRVDPARHLTGVHFRVQQCAIEDLLLRFGVDQELLFERCEHGGADRTRRRDRPLELSDQDQDAPVRRGHVVVDVHVPPPLRASAHVCTRHAADARHVPRAAGRVRRLFCRSAPPRNGTRPAPGPPESEEELRTMQRVTAICRRGEAARKAVEELVEASFPSNDISVILLERDQATPIEVEQKTGVPAGMAAGGVIGAALGLTAIAAFPGLLAAGPAVALLDGLAATATSAAGGSLIGAYQGLGWWRIDPRSRCARSRTAVSWSASTFPTSAPTRPSRRCAGPARIASSRDDAPARRRAARSGLALLDLAAPRAGLDAAVFDELLEALEVALRAAPHHAEQSPTFSTSPSGS